MKQSIAVIVRNALVSCCLGLLGFGAVKADTPIYCHGVKLSAIERIQAREELIVGMKEGESTPFFYLTDLGMDGLDVRLARAMSEELMVPFRIETFPTFDDVIDAVQSGDVDVGISKLSITPQRSAAVLFTKPYAIFRHGLVVNRKSLLAKPKEKGVIDLLKAGELRLGVIEGSYEFFAQDRLNDPANPTGRLDLSRYGNWDDLIHEVRKDPDVSHVDVAYRDEFEIQKSLSDNPTLTLYLRPYAFSDSVDRIAMAIHHEDIAFKFWLDEFIGRFMQADVAIRNVLAKRRSMRRDLLFKIVSIKDRLAAERLFLSGNTLDHYDVDAAIELYQSIQSAEPAEGLASRSVQQTQSVGWQ